MSITSLSFTFVNTYAAQSARPAAVTERKTAPAPADDKTRDEPRPAGRQSRLVQAMMSALLELGFGGPAAPAAPAGASTGSSATAASAVKGSAASSASGASTQTGATTGTTETPASNPSANVESAVYQFAHELFQALRQSGRGNSSSDEGSGRVEGEGHHRHRHHDRQGHGYGDISQRLEALAQTFGAQVPATAAGDAPASPAAPASLTVTLTVDDGSADTPAPASASASATPAPAATPIAAVVTSAKNPLLEAFSKLFNALKPQSTSSTTAPSDTDMAQKLRQFLHTLAQAVAPDAMSSVHSAQFGGLVNVTA